ncbi:MAG: V4R domain-containing protein [Candidatus Lokiarchaeia archaeon]
MKIEKTLINFIDDALGNLDEGTSMLFVCDSFTLNDIITLSDLVIMNFIKQGGGCIVVGTSLPISMLYYDILSRFSSEYIDFMIKRSEEGKYYYIDVASKEGFQKDLSIFKGVIRIDNDPNRIVHEINSLRNQIKKSYPENPVMISYQNFSSSFIDFGEESVLKMFRRLTIGAKQKGDIISGLVNRDLHDSRVINTLIHLADFVVELSSEEKGGLKQPYVRVLKSPNLEASIINLQQTYAYILSDNNFLKIPSMASDFEELKKNISYLEGGAVSIGNIEYLITPLNTFLFLFKELEKKLGMHEYREFMKDYGESLGLKITSFLRSEYGLKGNELLKEALNYFLVRGWGRIIKKEGSLESGTFKMSSFETLSHYYGKSDHKVCAIVGSILLGILEGVTGKKWSCEETGCIAIGDELCEFEAKVEK